MEVQSMDNYALDPVGCIRQFVIWNGDPAHHAIPAKRELASQHPAQLTANGSTVYIREFDTAGESDDEGKSSALLDSTTFNEEFAPNADNESGSEDDPFTAFTSAPVAFKWVLEAEAAVDTTSGMRACHSLKFLKEGPHRAFALPWGDERVIWMRLDSRCSLFFTDTMNGCALAIGGNPQSPVVAHSNGGFNGAQAAVDQLSFVRDKCADIDKWRVFSKADYISDAERYNRQLEGFRTDGTQANVVGVYRGSDLGWEFWCQRWMRYLPTAGGKAFLTDFQLVRVFPQ